MKQLSSVGFKKAINQAGVPIWKNNWFSLVIVGLASICDFVTIYSVAELYLMERMVVLISITACIAVILNLLPALLGTTLADKEAENKRLLVIVLCSAFITLFTITFLLRWSSRAMMFGDTLGLDLLNNSNQNAEIVVTPAQNILTVLMGCSTLFTSILSFTFSLIATKKEDSIKHLKEIRIIQLEEKRDYYLAHIKELERILEEDNAKKIEDEAYKNAVQKTKDYEGIFREITRVALAEYSENPEAAGVILQRQEPVLV